MQVFDGLLAIGAAVHHQPVAAFRDALGPRHLGRDPHQVTDQRLVAVAEVRGARDMLPGMTSTCTGAWG